MIAAVVFDRSPRDAGVLGAGLLHGGLVVGALSLASTAGPVGRAAIALLLAVGTCWGSNTVSHIHLHGPLFRGRAANRLFSLYLSVLLAVPQTWWKRRHLVHHGAPAGVLGWMGWAEIGAVAASVAAFAACAPALFASVLLPALLLGFGLCAIQGWQEHARGEAGVDHHGWLYNRLWFNDGFHAAHHRAPGAHWTSLPGQAADADVVSPLPPLARWLDGLPALGNRLAAALLDVLERATLGSRLVRWFLLATHRRAWRSLLAMVDRRELREVTIVGGGLFPRTALVLADLLPAARLTILDAQPAHLERARAFLGPVTAVRFVAARFEASAAGADLLVVPLAFRGDRARLYRDPPAPLVVVHDWLWRVRGASGRPVSLLLMKRLNLVRGRLDQSGPASGVIAA
jgi:hypothetical protein